MEKNQTFSATRERPHALPHAPERSDDPRLPAVQEDQAG